MLEQLPERIRNKIEVSATGCWLWTGARTRNGYGHVKILGSRRNTTVHRLVFELLVGRIPHGLVIDHVCHNNDPTCNAGYDCPHRRCCNPAHLEAVSDAVNRARGRPPIMSSAERAKASARMKANPVSPEQRERMTSAARASCLGKPLPAEQRAKIAAANLGKKRSPETRARISAAQRGKTISSETRAKISAANAGHPKAQQLYRCGGCEKVCSAGPLLRHQRATGHAGRVPLQLVRTC